MIRQTIASPCRLHFAAWAAAAVTFLMGTVGPARGAELTAEEAETLIGQLDDDDFAVRSAAALELERVGLAHVEVLEASAIRNPEYAARIVPLLERLYVGSTDRESRRLAVSACVSSLEPVMTAMHLSVSEHTDTTRAADQALKRLSRLNSPVAGYARSVFERHGLLRAGRAVSDLRQLGAKVVFTRRAERDESVLLLDRAASDQRAATLGYQPARPHPVYQVFILPGWRGNVESLELISQLERGHRFTVYAITGSGVTSTDIEHANRDAPGFQSENRGAATLGATFDSLSACEIRSVIPGMAASQAGLNKGDRILAIDDQRINTFDALVQSLRGRQVGEVVSMKVLPGRYALLPAFDEPLPIDPEEGRNGPDDRHVRSIEVRLSGWDELADFAAEPDDL
ncbi:MAG: PDZ domain-containing protein [Planctomyces sp.]|nr:PDZ domain-containing protein [Planctomyces sp.]